LTPSIPPHSSAQRRRFGGYEFINEKNPNPGEGDKTAKEKKPANEEQVINESKSSRSSVEGRSAHERNIYRQALKQAQDAVTAVKKDLPLKKGLTDDPIDQDPPIRIIDEWNLAGKQLDKRTAGRLRDRALAGTVSSRFPSMIGIEDLVKVFGAPEPLGFPMVENSRPASLTILVTPSFAKHVQTVDLPLMVLKNFHKNPTRSKPLNAIVAVVDRLPVEGGPSEGEEGISYAFWPHPESETPHSCVPLQSDHTKPGSLSFECPPTVNHFVNRPYTTTAQLQLAHTVFNTGYPSTLLYANYEFDAVSGTLRRSESSWLESATVPLPTTALMQRRLLYEAPLVPLTPMRQVRKSMGNIVRKLSKDVVETTSNCYHWKPHQEDLPASQELEEAVSAHFRYLGIAPEPVEVWAVIVPNVDIKILLSSQWFTYYSRTTKDILPSLWSRHGPPSDKIFNGPWYMALRNGRLFDALPKGVRVHKVLSGGGGWGKKAGLLSLDPDSQYSTRELRSEQGWEFNFEGSTDEEMMESGRKQAFGELVKEGEAIGFFLSRPEGHDLPLLEAVDNDPQRLRSSFFLSFGVNPPSVGRVPTKPAAPGCESLYTYHARQFGLLSEGGMAVTMTKGGETLTQTKLDVPYGRLRCITLSRGQKEAVKWSRQSEITPTPR
jgi:hypothetical protein